MPDVATPAFHASRPGGSGAHPTVFTIDPPMSRDLDDAIGATQLADGGWLVDVCIADVLQAVSPAGALDAAARAKGCSVYAGSMMKIPMLPLSVTASLSLLPRELRKMVWVRITLDRGLAVRELSVARIATRTAGRLSYAEADAAIKDRDHVFHRELAELSCLASALFARRHASGAIWNLKRGLRTDEEGVLRTLSALERHQSHLIVQEVMILANGALAAKAARENIPLLYRNHKPLGASSGLRAEVIAELAAIHGDGTDLRKRIGRVNSRIGPAVLGTAPDGHWALNVPAYAWFTSPLRRYADVINLRAVLGEPMPADLEHLAHELTVQERERRAATAAHLQSRALKPVIALVEKADLVALRGVPFRRVVRACEAVGGHDVDLEAELQKRLAGATLEDKDVFFLLTEGRSLMTEEMTESLVRQVVATPGRALQVANHLLQLELIVRPLGGLTQREESALLWRKSLEALNLPAIEMPAPSVAPSINSSPKNAVLELAQACAASVTFNPAGQSGPSHAPTFRAELCWVNGDTRHTLFGEGASKKDAEKNASLALLTLLRVDVAPARKNDGEPAGENYKGRLLELATRKRAAVEFEMPRRTGPDHAPTFAVRATWTLNGLRLEAEASGANKKAAEQSAALELLDLVDRGQAFAGR